MFKLLVAILLSFGFSAVAAAQDQCGIYYCQAICSINYTDAKGERVNTWQLVAKTGTHRVGAFENTLSDCQKLSGNYLNPKYFFYSVGLGTFRLDKDCFKEE